MINSSQGNWKCDPHTCGSCRTELSSHLSLEGLGGKTSGKRSAANPFRPALQFVGVLCAACSRQRRGKSPFPPSRVDKSKLLATARRPLECSRHLKDTMILLNLLLKHIESVDQAAQCI